MWCCDVCFNSNPGSAYLSNFKFNMINENEEEIEREGGWVGGVIQSNIWLQ